MSKRLPFLLAGLALLAMFATIALRWHRAAPADVPALQVVSLFPQPRVLPEFNLRQSDGTALVPASGCCLEPRRVERPEERSLP